VKVEALGIVGISMSDFVNEMQTAFVDMVRNNTGAEAVTIDRVSALPAAGQSRRLQSGTGVEVDFSVRLPKETPSDTATSSVQSFVSDTGSSGLSAALIEAAPPSLRSRITVDVQRIQLATILLE